MRKGTGIKNTPIDEVYDKLLPYTENDPLVLQVIGNTINALMSAFNTNYNTAWKLAHRLIHEFDVTLIDGRDLQGNYQYKLSKIYFHHSKTIYGWIHNLEQFALEHEITLTQKHCYDKIRYSQSKTKQRFSNALYFFLNGDLTIDYFIENPKPNQKEFALAYMQKFKVPCEYDVEFYNLNYSYYISTRKIPLER